MTVYRVSFVLTVHEGVTDEHVTSEQAIRDEISSWFDTLDAEVSEVVVEQVPADGDGR